MKLSIIALLFGFAEACKNQIISVRTTWSQPLTSITGKTFCTYTFKIPQDSFAVVDYYGNNVGVEYIAIIDDFGYQINLGVGPSRDSYAIPGNFQLTVETQDNTNMQLALNVTVNKVNLNNVVNFDLTQSPFSLFYVNEMVEGTSYRVSTNSAGKVNLQVANSYLSTYPQRMENIFVYSGGKLVGTLNGVYLETSESLISTNNELILYVAKKSATVEAVVLLTDYSNVAQMSYSRLSYQTDSSRSVTTAVVASETQEGCTTIVGPKNGTIAIQSLSPDNSNSGVVTILPGGPLANHANAASLSNSDLPKVFGYIQTVYITKGGASVVYKNN